MIFHPLTFNLLLCISLMWASCRQHTDGSWFLNNAFIYERERERGRKLGRERSRLPTRSRIWDLIPDSRITPWVKGRGSSPEPPRHTGYCFLSHSDTLYLWLEHLVYQHSEWLFKDMNFVPLCFRKRWCFQWLSPVLSSLCFFWSLFFPH